MKNLKVSSKLMVSFLITVALALIVGVTGILGITMMDRSAKDMYEKKALPLGDLTTATEYFQRLRVQTRNAIIYSGDATQLATVEKDMNQRIDQFKTSMNAYAPTIVNPTAKELYKELMDLYNNTFEPGILNVLDGAKQGQSSVDLLNSMAKTTEAANVIADHLSRIVELRMGVMESASIENSKTGNLLLIVIIAVIVVATGVSVLLAVYISSLISKPLNALTAFMNRAGATGNISLSKDDVKIMEVLSKIKDEVGQCVGSTYKFIQHMVVIGKNLESVSDGNLTVDVTVLSDNDTMGLSMQKMLHNLNNMFSEINASTAQVNTGAKQIADGSQALAQGSTEQAAAVEQLSSSISEIAQKTKDNAQMAADAASLANTIMQNAMMGSHQMDQMTQAVQEINEASQSISKIIGVIDNIAFQTNILALNAAVEAARAGQHGRGFAVVAEEVRSLASKSADAAKETGGMISNSMAKAELGARIAEETAASLKKIVSGIDESNRLVAEIAKSSEEQSEGIAQINKGIDQVAQVVQQNSATAEESAAASEEMSGQANMLGDLITQFRLKDGANRGGFNGLPSSNTAPQKRLVMPGIPSESAKRGNDDFGKY